MRIKVEKTRLPNFSVRDVFIITPKTEGGTKILFVESIRLQSCSVCLTVHVFDKIEEYIAKVLKTGARYRILHFPDFARRIALA